MELTREECEKAYEVINIVFHKEFCEEYTTLETPPFETFVNSMTLLEQLVKEHFDNPPLKFEELKKKMIGKPIYHSSLKRWFVIDDVITNAYDQKFIKVCHNVVDVLFFEEDVFFAMEVKDV